jgi:hypothetical protein
MPKTVATSMATVIATASMKIIMVFSPVLLNEHMGIWFHRSQVDFSPARVNFP